MLRRGYVEETKASEKLRKENAKAEERHALKAAREAAEQLQRSEDAYLEEQERKKKRQESTTRNAVVCGRSPWPSDLSRATAPPPQCLSALGRQGQPWGVA
jgi:hypothetical protein